MAIDQTEQQSTTDAPQSPELSADNNDEHTEQPDTGEQCGFCMEAGDLRGCSSCMAINYCSKTCQKADWSTHKILCPRYAAFETENPRPEPSSEGFPQVRALLFEFDERQPYFIWLPTVKGSGVTYEVCHKTLVKYLNHQPEEYNPMGSYTSIGSKRVAITNPRTRIEHPTRTVQLHYRDSFFFDGSMPNLAIINTVKAIRPARKPRSSWRGPVLAVAMSLKDEEVDLPQDFNLADFRTTVDALTYL